eukprot:704439_1
MSDNDEVSDEDVVESCCLCYGLITYSVMFAMIALFVEALTLEDATVDQCAYSYSKEYTGCTGRSMVDNEIECYDGAYAKHYYITKKETCTSLVETTRCECYSPPASAPHSSGYRWHTCYIDYCEHWSWTHSDIYRKWAIICLIIFVISIIITGCWTYFCCRIRNHRFMSNSNNGTNNQITCKEHELPQNEKDSPTSSLSVLAHHDAMQNENILCSKCYAANPNKHKFCSECGNSLQKNEIMELEGVGFIHDARTAKY